MARKATGQVIPPKGKQKSWAIRFTAYGKRRQLSLGRPDEGWNRPRVEAELENVLADVRRGIWQPHILERAEAPRGSQTFHEFASEWLHIRRAELRPRSVEDYEWALSYHLLPYFRDHTLDAITVADVDAFKAAKLREGRLGGAQINKVLKLLAQVMDMAIEYELTDRANPARGRRRRVKVPKPDRTWVEPEQLLALLTAADTFHRPVLATLAGAGLRAGEAFALDWRDVNLATGTLTVGRAKTDAGSYREVDMPSGLIEALGEWKAVSPRTDPSEPVFEPISERVSPHSLRRTYASIRAGAGDSPIYIAEQIGHSDFGFTFRVYQWADSQLSQLPVRRLDRSLDPVVNIGHGLSTPRPCDDEAPRQARGRLPHRLRRCPAMGRNRQNRRRRPPPHGRCASSGGVGNRIAKR
jgi:integrase